jgi:hypothetical protein
MPALKKSPLRIKNMKLYVVSVREEDAYGNATYIPKKTLRTEGEAKAIAKVLRTVEICGTQTVLGKDMTRVDEVDSLD